MSLFKSLAVMIVVTVATPATAQQVVMDPYFQYRSLNWSGNGTTILTWRAVLIDGKIAICGGYGSTGGPKYANLTRQAIRDMRIDGPNGTFMRDLSFFTRLSRPDLRQFATGALTNCRKTATSGSPADLRNYRFGFTPQNYRVD